MFHIMFIRIARSESMLRKSSFLWSLIRNRRVLPDGEPGRDERWDDDGDLGGDDDGDGGHDTFEYLADDNGYDYDDK